MLVLDGCLSMILVLVPNIPKKKKKRRLMISGIVASARINGLMKSTTTWTVPSYPVEAQREERACNHAH